MSRGSNRSAEDNDMRRQVEEALSGGSGPKIARLMLACLGGLIPFAGGAIGGAAAAWSESEQDRFNRLFAAWLRLQEQELIEIAMTLREVMQRLDPDDPVVQARLQSPEYLSLVRKCFRDWAAAESEDKRVLIRNLLTNAASTRIAPDDLIKLFIKWIEDYSEAHFSVIKAIYNHAGSTRHEIWERIHGQAVREDSAEADLFRLLIHDLSTGRVIRQHRETDGYGNFLKRPKGRPASRGSSILTSAFEDEKQYELTELGKQFVHYTMTEVIQKITSDATPPSGSEDSSE